MISVLTLAVASAILESGDGGAPDYLKHVLEFARCWPNAGYGGNFRKGFRSDDPRSYNSSEQIVLSEVIRSADFSCRQHHRDDVGAGLDIETRYIPRGLEE
jgi:hypothetical protein